MTARSSQTVVPTVAGEASRPRGRRALPLRAAVAVLLAIFLLVFAGVALTTWLGARRITDRMALVAGESNQRGRIATQLQLTHARQEIALLGYGGARTGPVREVLRRRFDAARREWRAAIAAAGRLPGLDGEGRALVEQLRVTGESWLQEVAEPQFEAIRDGREGQVPQITNAARTSVIQEQMDSSLRAFQRYVDESVEREAARTQDGANTLGWLMTGAVLAAALAALGALLYLRRNVIAPLAALQAPIAAARAGRLDVSVPRSGAAEVQTVSAALGETLAALDAARGELAREYERFRAAVAGLSEGVVVAAPDGGIDLANPAAVVLLDLPGEHGGVLPEPVRAALAASSNGHAVRVTINHRTLSLHAATLMGKVGDRQQARDGETQDSALRTQHSVIAVRDVTEEEQVERMKQEFISMVSHELRTPLTSIKGYTDLILDGDDLPEEPRRLLSVVQRNTDRLADLVNDLLDLSRIDAGRLDLNLALVDSAALIADAARTIEPLAAAKGQRLEIDLPPRLPPVWGDLRRLGQVLLNLLGNANKFTPPGGAIGIQATADGAQLRLTVWDSGPGIPPADQPHLFERFYRVSRADGDDPGGTGLGLAISRSIVELHGGRISVESAPGEGSRFSVDLPAHTAG